MTTVRPQKLNEWPLWRLLVALADAERDFGPASSTAKAISRVVQEKLRSATKEKPEVTNV
jgi:hypothetical protein